MSLTQHFKKSELSCKCGCNQLQINMQLLYALEVLRRILGKPIIINSGYRCPKHNAKIGGVTNSQHVLGTAADIRVPGMTPQEVYMVAKYLFDGLGVYDNFLHVDVRGTKARWGNIPTNQEKVNTTVQPKPTSVLPDGPTDQEIRDKLKSVE